MVMLERIARPASAAEQLCAQGAMARSEREASMQCLLTGFAIIHIPMRQVRGAGLQSLLKDVEGAEQMIEIQNVRP